MLRAVFLMVKVSKKTAPLDALFDIMKKRERREKMMTYVDMHCDTLARALAQKKETLYELSDTMADLKRLREAEVSAQFFAMFLPQQNQAEWFGKEEMPPLEDLLLQMYHIYQNTIENYSDIVAAARNYEQYRSNQKEGKMSAFLTIENGAIVQGDMERLRHFHEMGVSLITLTWNDENCFGVPHSKQKNQMEQGLTAFGKEAVMYMNELGILVDVSHLSDGGFYDVAEISTKPFVASHSNCRALAPATRNLTDDMIRILAEKGGVAGINLEPSFVNANPKETYSRVESLCDHIEHFRQVGGEDCIGIGTDFDGIDGKFEIKDCTEMHLLFECLKKRGYSERLLEKIAVGNVERVIKDSMN